MFQQDKNPGPKPHLFFGMGMNLPVLVYIG